MFKSSYPQRIVCLTEEPTETLCLLGAKDKIVGISGFTVRPKDIRKEKPVICTFTEAKINEIKALKPDLVVGFSDLQANIASQLIKEGIQVLIFNQRSVNEILTMMRMLGNVIGETEKAAILVEQLEERINNLAEKSAQKDKKPVVYFEEWYDPLISGIGWVSELIEIAGGKECFPEFPSKKLAKERIIADHTEVIRRQPDIIIGSWCGKMFKPEKVKGREGWEEIPAVRNGHLYEIKSSIILQPGPAALTDGLDRLVEIIAGFSD